MFDRIRKELDRQHAQELRDVRHYIEKGYFPTWAEEHRADADRGLKAYSTPAKWDAYTAGTLAREKAVDLAYKRAARKKDKNHAARVAKVDRAENAAPVLDISIAVEWKRSATWGHNPTATVTVHSGDGWSQYTGTASGYGYDKLTAAVGDALNQCPAVLRMLYTAKEKALRKSTAAERAERARGCGVYGGSNAQYIAYGAGYGTLPYFEGGTGWSSFLSVFAACGMTCTAAHETKTTDYYYLEMKGGRKHG